MGAEVFYKDGVAWIREEDGTEHEYGDMPQPVAVVADPLADIKEQILTLMDASATIYETLIGGGQ